MKRLSWLWIVLAFSPSALGVTALPLHPSCPARFLENHFHIPQDQTLIEVPVEQIEPRSHLSEHDVQEREEFLKYFPSIDRIRAEIDRRFGSFPQVRTVFYPLSGTDPIAARLFTQASVFIALDKQPFFGLSEKGFSSRPGLGGAFRWLQDVEREGALGPRLLGALQEAVPGFHLRRLAIFGNSESINGLIEYDQGEGTPIRQYVHIQGSVPSRKTKDFHPWWMSELSRLKPQALIVKGSMSFLKANKCQPEFRQTLLGWLKEAQGLILEGFAMDRNSRGVLKNKAFEFKSSTDTYPAEGATSLDLYDLVFSYGGNARVTVFR
jgi:hypothetical protein